MSSHCAAGRRAKAAVSASRSASSFAIRDCAVAKRLSPASPVASASAVQCSSFGHIRKSQPSPHS